MISCHSIARRIARRDALGFLVDKMIDIALWLECLEINQCGRIEVNAHEAGLEMQMRASRTSGVASESDRLTCLDILILIDDELREMSIDSLKSVGVTDHIIIAIATAVELLDAHLTIEGSTHGVAHIELEVDASMHATTTPAVLRSDTSDGRGNEGRDVDILLIRNLDIGLSQQRIDRIIVPRTIKVESREQIEHILVCF